MAVSTTLIALLFTACEMNSAEVDEAIAEANTMQSELAAANATDEALAWQIKASLLKEHGAAALDVDVAVEDGVVTLAGEIQPVYAGDIIDMTQSVQEMGSIDTVSSQIRVADL